VTEDKKHLLADDFEPTFKQIMGGIRLPAVYWNVPVHLFILIPATAFIAYLAHRLDTHFGLEALLPEPLNAILFGIFFPLGIFIVWYVYGYLAIKGEGGPATHLGGTQKLVDTGPFAACRHPSIVGKFSGVVGFGFLVNSPIFMLIVIPALTTYSLVSVRFWQERLCEKLWGDYYREYRKRVPLVVPLPRQIIAIFARHLGPSS
jgi:protein-S-isoprenylcysteine O-methyltransferase Ste14